MLYRLNLMGSGSRARVGLAPSASPRRLQHQARAGNHVAGRIAREFGGGAIGLDQMLRAGLAGIAARGTEGPGVAVLSEY